MKLGFRWYGTDDPVTLTNIRQIPTMNSIVTAIYDEPVGEIWPNEKIQKLKAEVEQAGLNFDVIESVPVHEDIKLGLPTRKAYIEHYKENIRRLAAHGIKVICYNFMPVFDWTRTDLFHQNQDGSTSLTFDMNEAMAIDPFNSNLSLPGWDTSYELSELHALFTAYQAVDAEKLWENLAYFLQEIIPVAEASGVKMAIHPDDPPMAIFGLPRILVDEAAFDRLLSLYDSEYNGITFCTGSLGSGVQNDIYQMLDKYLAQNRVPFIHIRNVHLESDGSFQETAHYSAYGSIDMVRIMGILHKHNFTGYLRPDHGRMIWGEQGRAGYGLYDRALGASYLLGIWETYSKIK